MTSLKNDTVRENLTSALEETIKCLIREALDDGSLLEMAKQVVDTVAEDLDLSKAVGDAVAAFDFNDEMKDRIDEAIRDTDFDAPVDAAIRDADFDAPVDAAIRDADFDAPAEAAIREFLQSDTYRDEMEVMADKAIGNAITYVREITSGQLSADDTLLADIAGRVVDILESRRPLPLWKRSANIVRGWFGW